MDIYENYDTTNMTPNEIMKLFKQAEWNEIKPVIKNKKKLTVFSNNKKELTVFSNSDFTVESPTNKKNEFITVKSPNKNKNRNKTKKSVNKLEILKNENNNIEEIKQKYCNDLYEYENEQNIKTDWNMWSTPNLINF